MAPGTGLKHLGSLVITARKIEGLEIGINLKQFGRRGPGGRCARMITGEL